MPFHQHRIRAALAGAALLAAATPMLSGCSSPSPGSPTDSAPAPASIQFGWLPNVENMATIVADEKGYFAKEGIDLTILPGGPSVVADAPIVSGKALMGVLSSEALANSVKGGADLVAVAATYQTSSSAIVTLASSGITTPEDLVGKRFGISESDQRTYDPFFRLTDVDQSKIHMVSTGADPASLVSGDVDAMSGTVGNQPIALRDQGHDVRVIRLADSGYNRWSGLFVVRRDSLKDDTKRARIAAMLTAIRKGERDAVADPDAAGKLVYQAYGKQVGLEERSQVEGAKVWADLSTEGVDTPLEVTKTGLASLQKFYDTAGIDVTAAKIFDTSLNAEVFGDE